MRLRYIIEKTDGEDMQPARVAEACYVLGDDFIKTLGHGFSRIIKNNFYGTDANEVIKAMKEFVRKMENEKHFDDILYNARKSNFRAAIAKMETWQKNLDKLIFRSTH